MNNVKMGIILFLVFMVFLYPIWPFTFKYAIFKITLYLCIFFVGLLVVRLIAYLISRLFGYSFWILPNINDDVSIQQYWKVYGVIGFLQTIVFNIQIFRWKIRNIFQIIRNCRFSLFTLFFVLRTSVHSWISWS